LQIGHGGHLAGRKTAPRNRPSSSKDRREYFWRTTDQYLDELQSAFNGEEA
jgi:hypothetical protein